MVDVKIYKLVKYRAQYLVGLTFEGQRVLLKPQIHTKHAAERVARKLRRSIRELNSHQKHHVLQTILAQIPGFTP